MSLEQPSYRVPDQLTLNTVNAVMETALHALDQGQQVFDFSDLQTLDSTALAFVLACRRAADQRGLRLQCANLPGNLTALATLYGVEAFLSVEAV